MFIPLATSKDLLDYLDFLKINLLFAYCSTSFDLMGRSLHRKVIDRSALQESLVVLYTLLITDKVGDNMGMDTAAI